MSKKTRKPFMHITTDQTMAQRRPHVDFYDDGHLLFDYGAVCYSAKIDGQTFYVELNLKETEKMLKKIKKLQNNT